MLRSPRFWYALRLLLLAGYAVALALLLSAQPLHGWVQTILVLLAIHLLEIPYARSILRGRRIHGAHLAMNTLLFGFLWWLPVKRRILAP